MLKKVKAFLNISDTCNWMISHFPPNYLEMDYLEPFCSNSILFNKPIAKEEFLNNSDSSFTNILRTLRDQCPEFIGNMKKIKYTKEVFADLTNAQPTDLLNCAVTEFALRRMSKKGEKLQFKVTKKEPKPLFDNLKAVSQRLQDVIILNKPHNDIMKVFNNKNTFLCMDSPLLEEDKDKIALSNFLHDFKGLAVVSAEPDMLYKNLFKDWHCKKHKSGKYLWVNY